MIVKLYGPGNVYMESKNFVEGPAGYAEARNYIVAAQGRGWYADGDGVRKVTAFFGHL